MVWFLLSAEVGPVDAPPYSWDLSPVSKGQNATLVIDELNPGGAQRQLVMLAIGLKERFYNVEVLVYHKNRFFIEALTRAGVPLVQVKARNRVHLVFAMRKAIRQRKPAVVVAFLPGPGMLAEVAGLIRRDFAIIASERSLDLTGKDLRLRVGYAFHRFADTVVCNSHAQRERLAKLAPHLESRIKVIVNGVDLSLFAPAGSHGSSRSEQLRILVLAQLQTVKNPVGLLEAVSIIGREQPSLDLVIDWYGAPVVANRRDAPWWAHRRHRREAGYHRLLRNAIAEHSLQDRFRLHPVVKNVLPLYHAADVVCLPSLYEGTSNVICEAMACGVPVLASRVGDNIRLVEEGRNGLLFNPLSPPDIANAIRRFAALPPEAKMRMGQEGRRIAEFMLSRDVFLDRFTELIEETIARRRRKPLGVADA